MIRSCGLAVYRPLPTEQLRQLGDICRDPPRLNNEAGISLGADTAEDLTTSRHAQLADEAPPGKLTLTRALIKARALYSQAAGAPGPANATRPVVLKKSR
jgi:hypothetical protein